MDIQRIRSEVTQALVKFALVEVHPTADGGVFVKSGLQTSAGNTYIIAVYFAGYPYQMPTVQVLRPTLRSNAYHRYTNGNLCYLHPSMWNPGRHDLTFVLARAAKWLNKYDVWCQTGNWPGAEVRH
jgi:hypothetical protein